MKTKKDILPFRKPDPVTLFGIWDRSGTAYKRKLEVLACGPKVMKLIDEESRAPYGLAFKPMIGALRTPDDRYFWSIYEMSGVFPRQDEEEEREHLLALSQEFINGRRAEIQSIRDSQIIRGKEPDEAFFEHQFSLLRSEPGFQEEVPPLRRR